MRNRSSLYTAVRLICYVTLCTVVLTQPRDVLGDEPFRVTYLRLTGINASLLVNNMLPPELLSALDVKRYHIVQTDAFVEAKNMLYQAGVSALVLGSDPLVYPKSALSEQYFDRESTLKLLRERDMSLLPPRFADWSDMTLPEIEAYNSLIERHVFPRDYMIYYRKADVISISREALKIVNPHLWRFLTQADLDNYNANSIKLKTKDVMPSPQNTALQLRFQEHPDQAKMIKLLRYVARLGLPNDFILSIGTPVYLGCGSDGIEFVAAIPSPRFQSLVLQNTRSIPVDINSFRFTKTGSMQLRRSEVTSTELDTEAELEAAMFPQKKLLPGEAIVFPLYMYMTQMDEDREQCMGDDGEEKEPAAPLTGVAKFVYLGEGRDEEGRASDERGFRVTAASLPTPKKCPKPTTFDYGPAIRLKSVNVDGTWYPIRRFDSKLVTMLASSESGSCPHLFAYDEATEEYINKGEVLVNANGRANERRERIEIMGSARSLRIWELGNETAFIDYVALVVVDDDNREDVLVAPDERLRHGDGKYLELEKGDKIDLEFLEGKSQRGRRFLEIEGYFLPYQYGNPAAVSAETK